MSFLLKKSWKQFKTWIFYPITMLKIHKTGFWHIIGVGTQFLNPKNIYLGNNVRIGRLSRLCSYKVGDNYGKIIIKDNCYIVDFLTILAGSDIIIEENNLIASYVGIFSENHSMDPLSKLKYGHQPLTGAPVTIKRNCWIGEKVLILPGVTIGEYSIIGAGSVVNKNIPPYSIAVGNPAKVIKKFDFKRKEWIKV
ncbi:MAG: acyltransferase [Muribaculaceae bacterium]|nr:acyltransferase [Muribaculaceae bacterium]